MSDTPRSAAHTGTNDLYYRHSGMIPIPGVVMTLVGGFVVGIIGALVYAYAVRWVPFIYVRFFCTLAFGFAVGFVTGKIARAGKIRNPTITVLLVAIVTLVAYYFAWVFWIKATLDQAFDKQTIPVADIISSPRLLWAMVGAANESGTWSMKRSDPVSGMALTAVWLIEAAIIFGTALFAGAAAVGGDMYCETCDRWTPAGTNLRRTVPGDPEAARRRLEAHDFAYIGTLPTAGEHLRTWWTFSHRRCPTCENLHSLSLSQTSLTTDDKGDVSTKINMIVDGLLMTPQEAQALLSAAESAQV
jgi:lysylphosphatidylglycerol synthetase-like protein (DUF2156 family)